MRRQTVYIVLVNVANLHFSDRFSLGEIIRLGWYWESPKAIRVLLRMLGSFFVAQNTRIHRNVLGVVRT